MEIIGTSAPTDRNSTTLTRAAGCWFALVAVAFVAYTAHVAFGIGGRASDGFFDDGLYNAVMLGGSLALIMRAATKRRNRTPLLLIGVGLLTWALGELTYTLFYANMAHPPYPGVDDGLWLAFYPLCYVGLGLL